ncbi:hypothetical protein PUNSTDRAFT_127331 [Punctularia strigosozonata HHB-11173 SS5]|uniref:uncharacterized protein n=1 Tax=Punctularia strigosozonata (strain HHB-11173) TaxID=741275 RepID=UPI000441720E|nr:uncharacterized protein PUNSTDRAFT_127331 [Punctularia strigosozonata HHB-11173 SS5]EIN06630.1 hypothetical protein PUNSTDRAFT_127331 [Punctularia strigosozonata HHB-11173 SS5]
METLPVELLHRIFALCCIDGGSTSRSLSLVSRYISAASESYRLHSVSLEGPARIVAFAAHVQALPLSARRAQHLLVVERDSTAADWRSKWAAFFGDMTSAPKINVYGLGRGLKNGDDATPTRGQGRGLVDDALPTSRRTKYKGPISYVNAEDQAKFAALVSEHTTERSTIQRAVADILRALSHSLENVTLYTSSTSLPACEFPMLKHLAIRYLRADHDASSTAGTTSSRTSLPSLKHLHIMRYTRASMSLESIADIAPRLARLRLSSVGPDPTLPQRISLALGVTFADPTGADTTSTEQPAPLSDIDVIMIQILDDGELDPRDSARAALDLTVGGLHRLISSDARARVLMLGPPTNYTHEHAIQHWQDLLNGGDGCWAMP